MDHRKLLIFFFLDCLLVPSADPAFLNSYKPSVPQKYVRTETVMGRKIFEFKSYRDGQLFRFDVPLDTRIATWRFLSNFTRGCIPGTVSVFLQAGSYPVSSPDEGRLPPGMKILQSPQNLTFLPENGEHSLLITSPEPGNWFLLAYINRKEKKGYVQETLDSRCSTWLHIKVEYQLEPNIIHLFPEKHNHQDLLLYHSIERPQTYRFYTGDNIWSAQVNITKCRIKSATDDAARGGTSDGGGRGRSRSGGRGGSSAPIDYDSCPLQISVSPRRPPDVLDPKTRKRDCNNEGMVEACSLDLYPEENSWHFITVTPTIGDRVIAFAISVAITDCPHPTEAINYFLVNRIDPNQICSGTSKMSAIQLLFPPYKPMFDIDDFAFRKCGKRVTLMRRTLPGIFSFEYELPTPYNVTETPKSVDLENELPSVLQFEIGPSDIGGTLSVQLQLDHSRLSGLLSEKYVLKACLSHGKRLLPRNDDGYPHRILPDHSVSNPWNRERFNDKKGNKISKHSKNREHTFDFDQDLDGVQDDTEDIEEAALCPGGRLLRLNVSATEHVPHVAQVLVPYPVAGKWFLTILPKCKRVITRRTQQDTYYDPPMQYCSRNSTPIQFRISSSMCVEGSCGKYGRCYQFFSGGNMFSTCTCFAGYKGWGCTDESEAVSEIDLLAATLLLCLSNLLYLPAVGLAIYRGFYTESFVYFANMIASTLYHACDQDVFSFCLMKYTVLQFCDFYTATMAYWVTVLAMGGLPDQAKSLLHMVGAVGVALAIEYDRTGVFTFLVPAVIGIFILISSWITHCSSDRICYPGLKYACCFFLPGITTIFGGLFMFVFLERETNYQFVHSAWHVAMAVAILFLLPKSPQDPSEDEKYTILDTRPPTTGYLPPGSHTESSFKHYPDGMENGPEVINVTSNANTMLTADTMTLRSASSLAALNNGGGGTLPRSSLVRNYAHGHGTLKKSADELRPLTADGHYHGHSHKPSMDTLRRVHFEKAAPPTVNGATPASPPKIMVPSTTAVVTTTIEAPTTIVTTATTTPTIPSPDDDDEGDTAM